MTADATIPTPRTDAIAMRYDARSHHDPRADQQYDDLLDLARSLERAIHENNTKVKAGCEQWACYEERERGERCPNCPMEYWIEI